MALGDVFQGERTQYHDPTSGAVVTQWTRYFGHSHHLYFTNSGWYDGGARLLFSSDRGNRRNLFSLNLSDGAITQVTQLETIETPTTPSGTYTISTSINPTRSEAYLWHGRRLIAVDLVRLSHRLLDEAPPGYVPSLTTCTADGQHVCTALFADFSHRFPIDLDTGYVGFRETFLAKPHSQILEVPIAGGAPRILYEEHEWIGHVNASPRHSHLLLFCHEGPWSEVGQRMWGLDRRTGEVWPIRSQRPSDAIGHEYWMADGERIGFHGQDERGPIYGAIRYDNSGHEESHFPHRPQHFHSLSADLLVEDGRAAAPSLPYLLLWRRRPDGGYDGPRVLCEHKSSTHIQQAHVHPRVAPDGRSVLFTSNKSGYCNVYSVELPSFTDLPFPTA